MPLDHFAHFASLAAELHALKNRVRNLIHESHWPTDGEWKESVLRSFLRRHLPATVGVGRGFVVSDQSQSKQLDVLVHDATKPVLFQDGDLVVVTPDAVRCVIEVKTSVDGAGFNRAIAFLAENAERIPCSKVGPGAPVFGLFAFEDQAPDTTRLLAILKEHTAGNFQRLVHCACLGTSRFIRFWNLDPVSGRLLVDRWHAYQMQDAAPGYFIHNIIEAACPQSVGANSPIWFPERGKEHYKTGEMPVRDT